MADATATDFAKLPLEAQVGAALCASRSPVSELSRTSSSLVQEDDNLFALDVAAQNAVIRDAYDIDGMIDNNKRDGIALVDCNIAELLATASADFERRCVEQTARVDALERKVAEQHQFASAAANGFLDLIKDNSSKTSVAEKLCQECHVHLDDLGVKFVTTMGRVDKAASQIQQQIDDMQAKLTTLPSATEMLQSADIRIEESRSQLVEWFDNLIDNRFAVVEKWVSSVQGAGMTGNQVQHESLEASELERRMVARLSVIEEMSTAASTACESLAAQGETWKDFALRFDIVAHDVEEFTSLANDINVRIQAVERQTYAVDEASKEIVDVITAQDARLAGFDTRISAVERRAVTVDGASKSLSSSLLTATQHLAVVDSQLDEMVQGHQEMKDGVKAVNDDMAAKIQALTSDLSKAGQCCQAIDEVEHRVSNLEATNEKVFESDSGLQNQVQGILALIEELDGKLFAVEQASAAQVLASDKTQGGVAEVQAQVAELQVLTADMMLAIDARPRSSETSGAADDVERRLGERLQSVEVMARAAAAAVKRLEAAEPVGSTAERVTPQHGRVQHMEKAVERFKKPAQRSNDISLQLLSADVEQLKDTLAKMALMPCAGSPRCAVTCRSALNGAVCSDWAPIGGSGGSAVAGGGGSSVAGGGSAAVHMSDSARHGSSVALFPQRPVSPGRYVASQTQLSPGEACAIRAHSPGVPRLPSCAVEARYDGPRHFPVFLQDEGGDVQKDPRGVMRVGQELDEVARQDNRESLRVTSPSLPPFPCSPLPLRQSMRASSTPTLVEGPTSPHPDAQPSTRVGAPPVVARGYGTTHRVPVAGRGSVSPPGSITSSIARVTNKPVVSRSTTCLSPGSMRVPGHYASHQVRVLSPGGAGRR